MDKFEKVAKNKNISWKAKGIYMYLCYSNIEGMSAENIVENGNDGRYAVLEAIKELEVSGVIIRQKKQTGKMEYKIK